MARSTRSSRRVSLKYSEEEYVLQAKPRKARKKNSADNDAKLQSKAESNEAPIGNAKGNLNDKKTISIFGSPVLRDRTNLTEQALKVDILMKKGTSDDRSGEKKNPTKEKATSAVLEPIKANVLDTENYTAKKSSAVGVRSNLGKVASPGKKSVLPKRSKAGVENERKISLRRSTDSKGNKRSVDTKKKFFKSKTTRGKDDEENILPEKKAIDGKRRKIVASEKSRLSQSFRLRQTTLKESFLKQSIKKNLRPNRALKNYCEDSDVSEKNNVEIQDKSTGGRKLPIYKLAKFVEKCENNAGGIYDFEYNTNDSRERIPKKRRKRRVGTSIATKKSKATSKKFASNTKATARSVVTKRPVKEADNDKGQDDNKLEPQVHFDVQNDFHNDVDSSSVTIVNQVPTVNTVNKVNTATKVAKPVVVKSVDLKGDKLINLTVTRQSIESGQVDSRGLRASSAFVVQPSVQNKTMMNHVLFNKSLSPISKAMDSFDPGSPWRAPSFTNEQFSRVKSVVQSTPQVRKLPTMLKTAGINTNSTMKPEITPGAIINETLEKNDENVNVSQQVVDKPTPKKASTLGKLAAINTNLIVKPASTPGAIVNKTLEKNDKNVSVSQKIVDKPTLKKAPTFGKLAGICANSTMKPASILGKSPRKFGTEISNVNVSSLGTIVINETTDESVLDAFDDNADDKENSAPICPSPKTEKSLNSPRRLMSSPLRTLNKLSTKTNFLPQPGPSGLQKRSPLSESRLLKQSNLNNFLNLDKVPTSTTITTIHGIFDDVHSTPITGKPVNSKITKDANVENAFGFDDDADGSDEFDIDVSPIKPVRSNIFTGRICKRLVTKVAKKTEGTSSGPTTARLSIGEIKRHLQLPSTTGKIKVSDPIERVEQEENDDRPSREEQVIPTYGKIVTFADTFDLSAETSELNNKENLLFADLEPVHFKQPPRHLYKRKRAAACGAYSDDEEEDRDGDAPITHHGTKKRKITKLEKQRQKKLEEWAKDLNETFEEINHFDLVIE